MHKKYAEFIKWAKENHWTVMEKKNDFVYFSQDITLKYGNIPDTYIEFLKMVKRVITPNEKTWFLCEDEYNGNSDIAFRWDEFERLSLAAAEDDAVWRAEIVSWWSRYFPIVLSVDGGYSFYAIDLSGNRGAIVRGQEPEFEEVEQVANSLEDFLGRILSNEIQDI